MTTIKNLFETTESRDQWEQDPNPLYPMSLKSMFDVGTDHQTTLMSIKPGMQQHLHYHRAGGDIFLILHGSGTLITAALDHDGQGRINETSQTIKAGDLYSIKPLEIHSLRNTGDVDLVILNIAPSTHGDEDCIEVF
jgi:mannose-6-phosphate isomerase-like protein (cupin superfamily)